MNSRGVFLELANLNPSTMTMNENTDNFLRSTETIDLALQTPMISSQVSRTNEIREEGGETALRGESYSTATEGSQEAQGLNK